MPAVASAIRVWIHRIGASNGLTDVSRPGTHSHMYSYTINKNGKNEGPFSLEQAKAGLADGTFAPGDLAWRPGLAVWAPLSQRLAEDCGETPPVIPNAPTTTTSTKKPFNWLIPAILSTLLCCIPFGVVAIIYAVMANERFERGDFTGSESSRKVAKGFTIASIVIGGILVLLAIVSSAIPAIHRAKNERTERQLIHDAREISSAANQHFGESPSIGAKPADNSALEKELINTARQISAAFSQRCAEESKSTAKLKELRPYFSGNAKGIHIGFKSVRSDFPAALWDFSSDAGGEVELRAGGRFILTMDNYQRPLSGNPTVRNQKGGTPQGIEFEVDTGSVVR